LVTAVTEIHRSAHIDRNNPLETIMNMHEQFARQAQDFFGAAKDARIPENFQAFAEDSVVRTREVYHKVNAATKDSVRMFEDVVTTAQAGAKAIGEKMLNNTVANTEAAFDAAQAIARARTLPEAARLQADFWQQQFAIAGAQSKELFDLSTKIARQTMESFNTVAAKGFDQFKKSA
jgi:phasin